MCFCGYFSTRLLILFPSVFGVQVVKHLGTSGAENQFCHPKHILFHDYQVTWQSYFTFQHFTQPNTKCLAEVEGDYSGLVLVANDQETNYSFDYKGAGQKWLPN